MKNFNYGHFPSGKWRKVLLFMRLQLILIFCSVGTHAALPAYSQHKRVNVNYEKESIATVLEDLQERTNYQFLYYENVIPQAATVTISKKNATVDEILKEILPQNGLKYHLEDDIIVISLSKSSAEQQSQQVVIRGRVTNEKDQPLAGVSVILQGTARGVKTDANGQYLITVTAGNNLVFSYVGYHPQTIAINTRNVIDVKMEVAEQKLGDVIVTGYRTIDEETATGSYTTIGQDVLDKKPVTNISHALSGLVAGLATVSSTIDGQDRFLIRGEGTMQTTQIEMDPLIVVDGFPIQGFTPTSVGGDGILNAKDPFSTINPNDVASITVLKDAAATAIYGARAANGVIVITTKKGKAGDKIKISVNGFISVRSKIDLGYAYNMASAESQFWFVENMKKYSPDYHIDPTSSTYKTSPYINVSDAYRLYLETFDMGNMSEADYNAQKAKLIARGNEGRWKDDLNNLVYRNSITRQYNVALRGGTNIHTYSFSAGYEKDATYLRGNDTERIMTNFLNSFKLHKRVTLDVGINASIDKGKNNGVNLNTLKSGLSPWTRLVDENGNYNHFSAAITFPYTSTTSNSSSSTSLTTVYLPRLEAEYADVVPSSWYYNPVQDAKEMNNTTERFNVRINTGLKYDIIDGLSVAVRGQYERNQYGADQFYSPNSYFVRHYNNVYSTLNASTGKYETYFPSGGILNTRGDKYEGYTFRAQADYNKQFGLHRITAVAGTEVISSTNELDPTIWRYGYNENTNAVLTSVDYVNKYTNLFGASVLMPYISPGIMSTLEDRFFSAYLDTEYNYSNRYTLTASLRADASNYQAENLRDKFSPFWSVGGAWIISRENFMQDAKWVNHLKLRASIGEAGLAAGKYSTSTVTTLSTLAGNIYHTNNEPYNGISARGNSTLTWEKSRTFDIAVDFRLWNDKLYGSIEYYNKFSYDVLSNASVPIISQGVTSSTFNNAEISNKGMELTLGTRMTIAGDLKWNGTLNISYNKNEVLKYLVTNTSTRPSYYVGYSKNHVWVYKVAGYTDEGYMILQGKDGTQETVKDRATTHYYDTVNGAAGDKVEDYNWTYSLGNSTPSTNASFSSTFTWKGLTFSFLITGKFDYYFSRNDNYGVTPYVASLSKTLDKAIKVSNEGYGTQTSYSYFPLYSEANVAIFSSGFTWPYMSNLHNAAEAAYLKGDHIRLNEIYLGYDLPRSILDKQKVFSGVNIFFQAKNLGVIWSANKVMDPDYLVGNIKPMTTFTFGLKFNIN